MEALPAADDQVFFGLASRQPVLAGQLDGALGDLRAAGEQGDVGQAVGRHLGDRLGQLLSGLALELGPGQEGDLVQLARDRLDYLRHGMADGGDGAHAAGGVDDGSAVGVVQVDALGANDRRQVPVKGGEEGRRGAARHRLHHWQAMVRHRVGEGLDRTARLLHHMCIAYAPLVRLTGPVMPDTFSTGSRSFAFAARFLPPPRRRAAAGLYAFARFIDDLVDVPPRAWSPEQVRVCLTAWRAWLQRPTVPTAPDPRLATGLLPALVTYRVPPRYLELLLDGVGSDLTRRDIRSWPELRHYCVRVASSVGLAMCYVLGAGQEQRARAAAVELGIAMQLTNILRDVGADLADGRVYLPADELAEYDYSRERLAMLSQRVLRREPGAVDDAFRALMRRQIARAHEHYERGLDGVWHLPAECRPSILLAGRLYRAILDEIEAADYVVFGRRAATSTRRKILEATRCLLVPSPAPLARRGAHRAAVTALPEAHS